MEEKKVKRTFSPEFKAEAVELASKIGTSKAAKELDIHESSIRNWRAKNQVSSSSGQTVGEIEKEIKKLRKENEYLKEINKVLKKSTAIFSQDQIGFKK